MLEIIICREYLIDQNTHIQDISRLFLVFFRQHSLDHLNCFVIHYSLDCSDLVFAPKSKNFEEVAESLVIEMLGLATQSLRVYHIYFHWILSWIPEEPLFLNNLSVALDPICDAIYSAPVRKFPIESCNFIEMSWWLVKSCKTPDHTVHYGGNFLGSNNIILRMNFKHRAKLWYQV